MEISNKITAHIAKLSNLSLTGEDENEIMAELTCIIDYMEKLNELNTEGIEPTAHILPVTNVLREDESHNLYSREDLLKNAPRKVGGCFHVPQVLE